MNQYIKNKIQNLSFKICHVILPGEILQPDKREFFEGIIVGFFNTIV